MQGPTLREFQNIVFEYTIRHKSILDILSKINQYNGRLNRSITKAATSCGCVEISTAKTQIPEDASLKDLRHLLDNDIRGNLCEDCQDTIETELGSLLFYLAALCNTLGLDMERVLARENDRVQTLTVFNLS